MTNQKGPGRAKILCYLFALHFLFSCGSKENEVETTFVFVGDVHYKIPEYHAAQHWVPQLASELDGLDVKPEFIIQTGDFFQGNRGTDIAAEASFAFKHFRETVKRPFFIAKGNHDTRQHYEREAFPLFSKGLGREISTSYYSFDKGNSHFIMLDCTDEDLSDQLTWLENDLKAARANSAIEHIFAASHYPLWIVARAGFTRSEFALPVASLMAKYKVDAFFCGHTHNKSVSVRVIDGQPVTQIMDAAVVEPGRINLLAPFLKRVKESPENTFQPGMLPLEDVHQILVPPSELKYYWGYQEGSTTSYNVVTVKGKNVRVDWYTLGRGLTRSYAWDEPGKIVDLLAPPEETGKDRVSDEDFDQIDEAWLYTSLWTDHDSISAPFLINGVSAGEIVLNKSTMAYSPFWNKLEIPIKASGLKALRKESEIAIINARGEKFGFAHIFILARLKDGRFIKSSISQKTLASFPNVAGVNNFPDPEFVASVSTGMPLEKVALRFEYFLNRQ